MRLRLLVATAIGAMSVLAVMPAAEAGQLVDVDVRKPTRAYEESNINIGLSAGQKRELKIRVKLTGIDSQMELQSTPSAGGVKYKYFSPGGHNITAAVTGSGHGFDLDQGEKRVFRVVVKSTGGLSACRAVQANGFDVGSSDEVFIRVNSSACS